MSILESKASFALLGSTACDNFSEMMKAQIQALHRGSISIHALQ